MGARKQRSRRGLLIAAAVVTAVLILVIVVLRDDVEDAGSSAAANRELYCSSIDGDVEVLIEWLGPTVEEGQRRAAAATVGSQFNDAFVEGAPAHHRDSAEALVEGVDALRRTPSGDAEVAATLRREFANLTATRVKDCPGLPVRR